MWRGPSIPQQTAPMAKHGREASGELPVAAQPPPVSQRTPEQKLPQIMRHSNWFWVQPGGLEIVYEPAIVK